MFHMVVDVAVNNPGSSVPYRGPEDNISIGWYLDRVLENRIGEVSRKALLSFVAVCVIFHNFFTSYIVINLAHSNNVEPTTMMMYWVSLSIWSIWCIVNQ